MKWNAVDMTASILESADLMLVQLHGSICIYRIPKNPVMCGDLSLCTCIYSVCGCVCVGVRDIRWSDRGRLSRCTLHKMRMQLVEEDYAHCVNRDNCDLISFRADSMCIRIATAPQNLSPLKICVKWLLMQMQITISNQAIALGLLNVRVCLGFVISIYWNWNILFILRTKLTTSTINCYPNFI